MMVFIMDDIKDLPFTKDNYNTLTLVGVTTENDAFTGSQDILVVDNGPENQQPRP